MKNGPMAPLPDPPCPLCSEPLAKGARRCDNCGSIVPETDRADLEEFAESLRSGDEGVKRLDSSKLLDAEGQISEELTTIPTTYLCPSCGAFVSTAEAKCSGCGAALQEEPADAHRLCPECGSNAPPELRMCAVCGTSLIPEIATESGTVTPMQPPPTEPLAPADRSDPAPEVEAGPEPHAPDLAATISESAGPLASVETDAAATGLGSAPPPAPPARTAPPPSLNEELSRTETFRELAAAGTLLALPVAAVATYANVAGHESGRFFVFGVMFGFATGLAFLDLRPLARHRLPILGFLVGTGILATMPLLNYAGVGSAVVEAILLSIGLIALGGSAWRFGEPAIVSLPWVSGLLLLSILSAEPLALAPPGETVGVQWAVAGGLALGPAGLVTVRRLLRKLATGQLLRADEEYARRDFGGAIAAYDTAIRLARRAGREIPAGWYGKGAALVAAGKPEKAIVAFDHALALSPENEIAWINKGTALSRLGRLNDALKCYNSAIKVNPAYEVAWNNKGNALARLGKHEIALACYSRALEIDESYRTAWVNKGFVLAKLGRFEEAAACADTALRLTAGAAASG